MPAFEQATYGTEVWSRGSRGQAGPFREPGLPLIRNLRMTRDGSLVVRPAWFRWGWDGGSETFLNLVGHAREQSSVFWAGFYRDNVATFNIPAFGLLDSMGTKIFQRDTVTNPLTEKFSTTDVNGTAVQQFGFGYIHPVNRYDSMIKDVFVRAQGIGALAGNVSKGGLSLTNTFIPGGNDFLFVGATIHQGRAFYWGPETEVASDTTIRDNRIWYSDPYDYTRFSANTQFFDVDGEVRGAVSIGPNLIIWTVEGNWFMLQGRGDPSRGVLHNKGKNPIPAIDDQPARFKDFAIYNSGNFDLTAIIGDEGDVDTETLARFGSTNLPANTLANRRSPPAASPLQDAITIPSFELAKATHLSRGVWVEEEWTINGITFDDRTVLRSHSELSEEILAYPADQGGGNYDFQIYTRQTVANEPSSYLNLVSSRPAETVDGTLQLPRIWNPDLDLRIVQVTIDARYWKSTGIVYDTPKMSVNIETSASSTDHPCIIGPDNNMIANLPIGTFGVPQSVRLVATPTEGTLPMSSWSEVKIEDIRSFAIEQVMVEYELSARRAH